MVTPTPVRRALGCPAKGLGRREVKADETPVGGVWTDEVDEPFG